MYVQTGGETNTEMGSFLLCGEGQLHDLHSKLRLEHPGGTANQLHKCALMSLACMHSAQQCITGSVAPEHETLSNHICKQPSPVQKPPQQS